MNHWYNEIMKNNPIDYHRVNNPMGHSAYISGILNPYAYPPKNNPSDFDSFYQEFVVYNKKRGLSIISDLMYQDNRTIVVTKGLRVKNSYSYCRGFNY